MATYTINTINESDERFTERTLKKDGFKKVSDCMWVKIYVKGNTQYIINRQY